MTARERSADQCRVRGVAHVPARDARNPDNVPVVVHLEGTFPANNSRTHVSFVNLNPRPIKVFSACLLRLIFIVGDHVRALQAQVDVAEAAARPCDPVHAGRDRDQSPGVDHLVLAGAATDITSARQRTSRLEGMHSLISRIVCQAIVGMLPFPLLSRACLEYYISKFFNDCEYFIPVADTRENRIEKISMLHRVTSTLRTDIRRWGRKVLRRSVVTPGPDLLAQWVVAGRWAAILHAVPTSA